MNLAGYDMNPFVRATVIWANLLGMIFLISFASYVYTHDEPYLVYPNLPFEVLQSAVRVGHTVPMKIDRCNNDDVPHVYSFSRRLINDDNPNAPPINIEGGNGIQLEPGCHEEISEANRIPTSTPLGRYHLEGVAEIHSKFHNYLVPWRSKTFQVVEDVTKGAP